MENQVKDVTAAVRSDTIKYLIVTAIKAGLTTKEITVLVQERFPLSAAAAKPVKHIAWYRTKVKQGKIV